MVRRILLYHLLLLCCLMSSGCAGVSTRLVKVLLPPEFVYRMEPTPPPAVVTYKTGYKADLPVVYRVPRSASNDGETVRPPTVTRDGWIEVVPRRTPVLVRIFVRNIGIEETEFFELKSFTGNVPYELASEIRFVETLVPTAQPTRIVLRNLKNPYNGYTVRDSALVLIEVVDPAQRKTWRYLFEYKDFGSRQKISFNVVINVPAGFLRDIGIPNVGSGVGNAAFTMSYSFGYRFRTQNKVLQWLGDKVSVVGMIGTSATPVFDNALFNQLSVGVGVEYYDFLSTGLLMDTDTVGNFAAGRWGIVIGFDAVRAADFTRKLTQKLFGANQLK